jgi:hypothetical protein
MKGYHSTSNTGGSEERDGSEDNWGEGVVRGRAIDRRNKSGELEDWREIGNWKMGAEERRRELIKPTDGWGVWR